MKLSEVPPPPPRTSGFECGFAAVWNAADDDDRAWITANLNDPSASDAWVADQITEHLGVEVDHQQVARHRRDRCKRCRTAGRVWI